MAEISFSLKVTTKQPIEASACASHIGNALEHFLFLGPYEGASFRIAASEPDSVAPHGEHGMADGLAAEFGRDGADTINIFLDPRPPALDQSKERSTDCTCGMGVGAQPTAHHPACGAYAGSVTLYHGLPTID